MLSSSGMSQIRTASYSPKDSQPPMNFPPAASQDARPTVSTRFSGLFHLSHPGLGRIGELVYVERHCHLPSLPAGRRAFNWAGAVANFGDQAGQFRLRLAHVFCKGRRRRLATQRPEATVCGGSRPRRLTARLGGEAGPQTHPCTSTLLRTDHPVELYSWESCAEKEPC